MIKAAGTPEIACSDGFKPSNLTKRHKKTADTLYQPKKLPKQGSKAG